VEKRKFVCEKCGRVYFKTMKKSPAKKDCFCHDCQDYSLKEDGKNSEAQEKPV
jgi:hypothetical protein